MASLLWWLTLTLTAALAQGSTGRFQAAVKINFTSTGLDNPLSFNYINVELTSFFTVNQILQNQYHSAFLRPVLIELRPLSTQTELQILLLFNTSSSALPNSSDVENTLKIAVANGSSPVPIVNLTVMSLRPAPTFTLKVEPQLAGFQTVLAQFLSALSFDSNHALIFLQNAVLTVTNSIFREKYPSSFVRTLITDFRFMTESNVSVAKVELEFNSSSVEPIPQESDILDTLSKALKIVKSGLDILDNLPVRGLPESFTSVLNIAKELLQRTNITTISAPRHGNRTQFTTSETFSSDLSNSSTRAYKDRVRRIKTEMEPFFFEDFPSSFLSVMPTGFSPGSIINNIEMLFTSDGRIPSDSAIVDTIQRAARSGNLTFDITAVNGISLSTTMAPSTNATVAGGSPDLQMVSSGLAMWLVSVQLMMQWLVL